MATSKRTKRSASARLAALEQRVADLEREVTALKPPPKEPPKPPKRTGPRCPGCSLPVDSMARGTCPWCGFVFDTMPRARRRKL